jgi:antitoxin ParD1/3/4
MTRLQLSVPDDLGAWAEARAIEAQLGGAGEYLATLLARERADADALARLQAAIDEGRASGISERDAFEHLDDLRAALRRDAGAT